MLYSCASALNKTPQKNIGQGGFILAKSGVKNELLYGLRIDDALNRIYFIYHVKPDGSNSAAEQEVFWDVPNMRDGAVHKILLSISRQREVVLLQMDDFSREIPLDAQVAILGLGLPLNCHPCL